MKIKTIALATAGMLLTSSQLFAHGYVGTPKSRAVFCQSKVNHGCGDRAAYEPQSIEQADGSFVSGVLNGNMGSAKVSGFEPLDEQLTSVWAKTVKRPGKPLAITWNFTANHSAKSFKFYITKKGWDPDKVLTRDSFELTPLSCTHPASDWPNPTSKPNKSGVTFTCQVPDRDGYQVILSAWDIYDTAATFYNLIDLEFSNDKPVDSVIDADNDDSGSNPEDPTTYEKYDKNKAYSVAGTKVIYDGKIFSNKWWVNAGDAPNASNLYGPWELIGDANQDDPQNGSHPVEATKFTIDPDNVNTNDIIGLTVVPEGGKEQTFDVLKVPANVTSGELLKLIAVGVNKLSTESLGNNLLAGARDGSGNTVPSPESVYVYQTSNKPYSVVTFKHTVAAPIVRNELHLMGFLSEYTLSDNGALNINATIMSHASMDAKVSVTLQDSKGDEVDRVDNITIKPMTSYALNRSVQSVAAGNYEIVVSSEVTGAPAWQKTMIIAIKSTGAADPIADEWSAANTYVGGDVAVYDGVKYKAHWWTKGDKPADSGKWGVWRVIS